MQERGLLYSARRRTKAVVESFLQELIAILVVLARGRKRRTTPLLIKRREAFSD